jgi:ADP-heptose:LPS heptosyltransferase
MKPQRTTKQVIFLALGPIGEALMMLAVLAEVAAKNPDMQIRVLARRNAALIRALAAHYPSFYIDDISTTGSALRTITRMQKNTTIVIQPTFGTHTILIKGLAALWSLVPGVQTLGFRDHGWFAPYDVTRLCDFNSRYIDNIRMLLTDGGIDTNPLGTAPLLSLSSRPPVEFALPTEPFIIIHAFASNDMRSLPPHRWKELVNVLNIRYPKARIVITGSEADRAKAQQWFGSEGTVFIACGLAMPEITYLIEHAVLYIGVDTGITHLAGVLRKQSVVIGNNSNPLWLPTYNPNAQVLLATEHCTCDGKKGGECYVEEEGQRYYRCLYEITDATIYDAIDSVMKRVTPELAARR